MNGQLVTLQDQTSGGLDPTTLFNWSWALNYQAIYHYGRSPWVERGYAPPAQVHLLPKGMAVPAGAWNIALLDVSDTEGALGYHEDQAFGSSPHSSRHLTATGTPYSKVFVQTAQSAGVDPCEVASHEMLEMLVDPYVANEAEVRKVLNKAAKEFYIVEVGDPVQGFGYDLGAPEGRHCGVTVADFAYPAWWGMAQSRPDMSFRDAVSSAFQIGPQGYMSVQPEAGGEWSQIYGQAKVPVKEILTEYISGPKGTK